MRVLVTSDWQADYENLELCKLAAEEVLSLKDELGFKVLVHAGDLKHVYNPIDMKVINFWFRTLGKWRQAGLDIFIDLGNHDRIGMYVDKQNWLPVLRKGGAKAFDEPCFVDLDGDTRIGMLPFRISPVVLKREAHDLAASARAGKDILIFHSDLQSAKYNVLAAAQSGSGIQVRDLCPERYLYCVGGHIHFQQKVAENVWYVGSPFATDWGEANQKKGYLLIDTEEKTIKRIRSKIPGWYDPAWPEFEKAKPDRWNGAKIRIKVPCNEVQHVREILEKARVEAVKTYVGASVTVIPEFGKDNQRVAGAIKLSFPDEKKIKVYVQETLPDELKNYESAVRKFLVEQLSLVGGLQREHGELKFIRAKAKNFLSYKELEVRFEPGLCVIAGENRDWKGRSNGCLAKGSFIDCPRDLEKYPYGIPIEKLVGRQPYVYSYDENLRRIVLKKASWVKKTGTKVAVVKVTFKEPFGDPSLCLRKSYRPQQKKKRGRRIEQHTELTLTADHLVLLRNGQWKEAGKLVEGDRVMPLYRKCIDGKYWSLNLNNGESALEHRFILSELRGKRSEVFWDGHHRDERPSNNSVGNLVWKTKAKHQSDHAKKLHEQKKFGWQYGSEHPRGMLGKHHSDDGKEKISVGVVSSWKDKGVRKARLRGVRKYTERVLREKGLLGKKRLLTKLYVGMNLSSKKIAKKLGCGFWNVDRALRWYGIKRNHMVVSIVKVGRKDVYDIHVPGTSNFVANSVVVHNSGKSSYLQLIAVAHSGQTFKGQKHDSWMRRGTKKDDESFVKIWFQDSQERDCTTKRARQPKELKLVVGGDIVESGNRPENTQKLIEQVTGYTWETLANAIYIDQASSHLMLTGTESERKGFLSKLQNLERFERAEKAIREQESDFAYRYEVVSDKLQSVLTEEKNLIATISDAKRILALNASISVSYKKAKRRFLDKRDELRAWEEKGENKLKILKEKAKEETENEMAFTGQLEALRYACHELAAQIEKFKEIKGECPVCLQPVSEEYMEEHVPILRNLVKKKLEKADEYKVAIKNCQLVKKQIEERMLKWVRNKELAGEVSDLQIELEGLRSEWKQYQKQQELIDSLRKKVNSCRKREGELTEKKNRIGKWLNILKYAQSVFKRNGLPAYLNEQICPELNQAAEEYAELFAQREIQVRFDVDEEGRMDVKVINAHGGESVEDQSEGEMKMASLITSFAVRSVAPKTNILILDEPGDGLDATSAKSFAKGLKEVVPRFGCILLTTHNSAILSELADAKLVMVRKENGISEVVEC